MPDAVSSTLLVIVEIVGPIVLAAALIYATIVWSRRRRARLTVSEAATSGLYREAERQERMDEPIAPTSSDALRVADELPANPKLRGQLRSGREEGRRTEDEIARQRLGVTGSRNASKPKGLDERQSQLNRHRDPGHTA